MKNSHLKLLTNASEAVGEKLYFWQTQNMNSSEVHHWFVNYFWPKQNQCRWKVFELWKLSQSKSKSKVQSRKDLEWLYSAVPPPTTTTHKNFSLHPNIQLSSNFHSRLTWPRLDDFRTIQELCPPHIQLLTWRTRFLMFNWAQIFTVDLNNQDKFILVKVRHFDSN